MIPHSHDAEHVLSASDPQHLTEKKSFYQGEASMLEEGEKESMDEGEDDLAAYNAGKNVGKVSVMIFRNEVVKWVECKTVYHEETNTEWWGKTHLSRRND